MNIITLSSLARSANELSELVEDMRHLLDRIDTRPDAQCRLERDAELALPLIHWLADSLEEALCGELDNLTLGEKA